VAVLKGTKAINVFHITSIERGNTVKEVIVDTVGGMNLIAKKCFPKTEIVTVRFHVQKLASKAVQEERIRLRWENHRTSKYSNAGSSEKWKYTQA